MIHQWVTVQSDRVTVGGGPNLQDVRVGSPTVVYANEAATLFPRQSAGLHFRVSNPNAINVRITQIATEGAASVIPECKAGLRFFNAVASKDHPVVVPDGSMPASRVIPSAGTVEFTIPAAVSVTEDGYAACVGHTFRTVWKVGAEPA